VVERNWRCTEGEIDLVVLSGDVVVFVEVKARASDRFGTPATAVDARKQRRLRILATRWLAQRRAEGSSPFRAVRFDVVAVTGTRVEVVHAAF
jgi:putative endonuclease